MTLFDELFDNHLYVYMYIKDINACRDMYKLNIV